MRCYSDLGHVFIRYTYLLSCYIIKELASGGWEGRGDVSLSVWVCVHLNGEGQKRVIDSSGLELILSACVSAPYAFDMN